VVQAPGVLAAGPVLSNQQPGSALTHGNPIWPHNVPFPEVGKRWATSKDLSRAWTRTAFSQDVSIPEPASPQITFGYAVTPSWSVHTDWNFP